MITRSKNVRFEFLYSETHKRPYFQYGDYQVEDGCPFDKIVCIVGYVTLLYSQRDMHVKKYFEEQTDTLLTETLNPEVC